MALEVLAIVKHDCPVCDQLLPALDAGRRAPRVAVQRASRPPRQARRLSLSRVPEVDAELALSERFDPDAVPAVFLLDDGAERERVIGLARDRLVALVAQAGATLELDGLPGDASRLRLAHPRPEIAARLAARRARASGRITARELEIGDLEDPFEAMHERGLTDGLPVVPPTPERVVAMLDHTSRDPQELVGVVPPYGGRATVEKVAINAVMAGCAGPELPIVLAAVEAACREEFALHGLIATTAPPGPVVVVSGPYAERAGMNSAGQRARPGQPRQLDDRPRAAADRPQRRRRPPRPEDRAAHGQPGKVGFAFAERLDETAPWPGWPTPGPDLRARRDRRDAVRRRGARGWSSTSSPASPRRWPPRWRSRSSRSASPAPAPRLGRDAGGRSRARTDLPRGRLVARARPGGASPATAIVPPASCVRGAGGIAEGLRGASGFPIRETPVPKFAAPERILLAYAGGDAGLFSMVIGGWVSGEIGSAPQSVSVEPWR